MSYLNTTKAVFFLAISIFAFVSGTAIHSSTLRVPSEWPTIQDAVNAATQHDTILLAPGTYSGFGNCPVIIEGKSLTIISEEGPENTALVGATSGYISTNMGINHADVNIEGIRFVKFGPRWSVQVYECPGGTIRNCDFVAVGPGCPVNEYFSCSSVSVLDSRHANVISCNFSNSNYVGIDVENSDDTTIEGCAFYKNANVSINFRNESDHGLVKDCMFLRNDASCINGMRFPNRNAGSFFVENCVFIGNRFEDGSCIRVRQGYEPYIISSTFVGNYSDGCACVDADEMYEPFFTSNLSNCILWGNESASERGINLVVKRSTFTVDYCDIEFGRDNVIEEEAELNWGGHNFDADPLIDPADPDGYRLGLDSPCIDAGPPEDMWWLWTRYEDAPWLDMDGDPRLNNGAVDVGADEALASSGVSLYMPAHEFFLTMEFYLDAYVYFERPSPPPVADLVALLDVNVGIYWFWPAWTGELSWRRYEAPVTGTERIELIEPFIVETSPVRYDDVGFWGALLDESHENVIGDFDYWRFDYKNY